MSKTSMTVRIWGARGSIPCPGANSVKYGGNTSCIEVLCGDRVLIFDAGSGLRMLGNSMMQDKRLADVDLFLSHCHIDHIIGLPFFTPAFEKGSRVRLWAGNLKAAGGLKAALQKLMSYPLFPIEIEMAQGEFAFNDFEPGATLEPHQGISVRTAALNHPGGATGYRVEYAGRSIAYVTDTELNDGVTDPRLLALVQGVSLLIIDATYTDEELPSHIGWGHSSWQQVVRLAESAGVKTLCLFHHDPEHDDAFMDKVAAASANARAGTIVAHEGMTIEI